MGRKGAAAALSATAPGAATPTVAMFGVASAVASAAKAAKVGAVREVQDSDTITGCCY